VAGEPGFPRGNSYASALDRGAEIGPSVHFSSRGGAIIERSVEWFCFCSTASGAAYGNWFDVSNRFLGAKFLIDGEIHYGWVRMGSYGNVIDGYAYETIPNKPIFATPPAKGQSADTESEQTSRSASPPSFGTLALGAHGLAMWRQESLPY
jgi:hypothetical protein